MATMRLFRGISVPTPQQNETSEQIYSAGLDKIRGMWRIPYSTVLTSNKSFDEWGQVLGDEVMAAALIARLLHHCHIVNIRGNSYRMRCPPESVAIQGAFAGPRGRSRDSAMTAVGPPAAGAFWGRALVASLPTPHPRTPSDSQDAVRPALRSSLAEVRNFRLTRMRNFRLPLTTRRFLCSSNRGMALDRANGYRGGQTASEESHDTEWR